MTQELDFLQTVSVEEQLSRYRKPIDSIKLLMYSDRDKDFDELLRRVILQYQRLPCTVHGFPNAPDSLFEMALLNCLFTLRHLRSAVIGMKLPAQERETAKELLVLTAACSALLFNVAEPDVMMEISAGGERYDSFSEHYFDWKTRMDAMGVPVKVRMLSARRRNSYSQIASTIARRLIPAGIVRRLANYPDGRVHLYALLLQLVEHRYAESKVMHPMLARTLHQSALNAVAFCAKAASSEGRNTSHLKIPTTLGYLLSDALREIWDPKEGSKREEGHVYTANGQLRLKIPEAFRDMADLAMLRFPFSGLNFRSDGLMADFLRHGIIELPERSMEADSREKMAREAQKMGWCILVNPTLYLVEECELFRQLREQNAAREADEGEFSEKNSKAIPLEGTNLKSVAETVNPSDQVRKLNNQFFTVELETPPVAPKNATPFEKAEHAKALEAYKRRHRSDEFLYLNEFEADSIARGKFEALSTNEVDKLVDGVRDSLPVAGGRASSAPKARQCEIVGAGEKKAAGSEGGEKKAGAWKRVREILLGLLNKFQPDEEKPVEAKEEKKKDKVVECRMKMNFSASGEAWSAESRNGIENFMTGYSVYKEVDLRGLDDMKEEPLKPEGKAEGAQIEADAASAKEKAEEQKEELQKSSEERTQEQAVSEEKGKEENGEGTEESQPAKETQKSESRKTEEEKDTNKEERKEEPATAEEDKYDGDGVIGVVPEPELEAHSRTGLSVAGYTENAQKALAEHAARQAKKREKEIQKQREAAAERKAQKMAEQEKVQQEKEAIKDDVKTTPKSETQKAKTVRTQAKTESAAGKTDPGKETSQPKTSSSQGKTPGSEAKGQNPAGSKGIKTGSSGKETPKKAASEQPSNTSQTSGKTSPGMKAGKKSAVAEEQGQKGLKAENSGNVKPKQCGSDSKSTVKGGNKRTANKGKFENLNIEQKKGDTKDVDETDDLKNQKSSKSVKKASP